MLITKVKFSSSFHQDVATPIFLGDRNYILSPLFIKHSYTPGYSNMVSDVNNVDAQTIFLQNILQTAHEKIVSIYIVLI